MGKVALLHSHVLGDEDNKRERESVCYFSGSGTLFSLRRMGEAPLLSRLAVGSDRCTLRYVGLVDGTQGLSLRG